MLRRLVRLRHLVEGFGRLQDAASITFAEG
jgi:hypothetical protein